MSRLGLIIQREYLQIVAKKSFIFTTILLPILMVALCGILPVMLANVKSDEKKNVAIIEDNPAHVFQNLIDDTEDYHFLKINESVPTEQLFEYYIANKDDKGLYAIVQIPDSLAAKGMFYVYSDQTVNASLERDVTHALRPILEKEKIASFGIDSLETIMQQCKVELTSKNIKWGKEGEEKLSSAELGMFIGMGLSFLTYFFVLMYGAMIMNGVIEEKTNRIVEVIVSSCKPMELMFGKIIGVALVGFTQIVVWGILLAICGLILGATVLTNVSPDPALLTQAMNADPAALAANPELAAALEAANGNSDFAEIVEMILSVDYTQIFWFFVLYFIGGYILYAALFAAFGSAVDQPSDASQFMTPIMIIMVFAFYAACFSIENPDGPLSWWCSIIPFTSPICMMIRLPYDVPVWEMLVSIVLLYASAFGILYIAGRIYRTGILMYGKKTSFKDMVKWLK